MSDSSGAIKAQVATGSGLTDLTLAVRVDGVPDQEVFLQHGLSLGRNASNTICVSDPAVERIHAMVCRQADGTMLLECTDNHLRVRLGDNSEVHSVPLKPGTTFKLGSAVIRCLKRETKATVVVADNPWEVRCPRCHGVMADVPHNAKACPHCELALQFVDAANEEEGPDTLRAAGDFRGWLPKHVGPYRIRAFVAQGGMGIILRGLHGEKDTPAAIKLLKLDSEDDPTWRQRFIAEIDTLRTLKHPNVVRLQDHGEDQKMLWLAMDWIDGMPLTKLAAQCRSENRDIPIEQIRSILAQAVTGLKYLHERQIIHRDLKPSNLLLAQDDLVKMVDFGIARGASGQSGIVTQLTQTGMVAGTESYMSPEQAEGQTLTPACDIYSLGVMWYELVVGRRPVGAFAAPHLLRPDCPPVWSSMIGACLNVDPFVRPTLDRIMSCLTGQTAEPPPLPGMRGIMTPPPPPGARPPGSMTGSGKRLASIMPPPTGAAAPQQNTGVLRNTTGQAPWTPPTAPAAPSPSLPQSPRPAVMPPPALTAPPARTTPPATATSTTAAQPATPVPQQPPSSPGHTTSAAPWHPPTAASYPAQPPYQQPAAYPAAPAPYDGPPPPKALAWLLNLGSFGRWILGHLAPSIAIAAVVALILLILTIRACSSDGSSQKNDPAPSNNITVAQDNNPLNQVNIATPQPNNRTPEVPPIERRPIVTNNNPQDLFRQGVALSNKAAEKYDVTERARLMQDSDYKEGRSLMVAAARSGHPQAINWLKSQANLGDFTAKQELRKMGYWVD